MSAYAKLFASVLAASGLTVATASDDPISLDGMGSMMADIRDTAAEPVSMPKAVPLPPAPVAAAKVERHVARDESCPDSKTTNISLKISAADLSFAIAHEGLQETVEQLADVQAQVAAIRHNAKLMTVSTHDVAVKAVRAARVSLKENMADIEPVIAERIEFALVRAETGLKRQRP